ncbi:MAG: segregation and condensation protein A [Aeromonas sp.]
MLASDSVLPPLARLRGEPLHDLPPDLFIPPQALEVILDSFEGPLDLLLYLIRRQQLDILDLPMVEISRQYMAYVELMQGLNLELAAEYLLMAAWLAEIKSRLLLPKPAKTNSEDDAAEADPRAQLVERLQAYEELKSRTEAIEALPRLERELFLAAANPPDFGGLTPLSPEVSLAQLANCFKKLMAKTVAHTPHVILRESIPTAQRMAEILARLADGKTVALGDLLHRDEGRMGLLVTFLALLELCKRAQIWLLQAKPLGEIHLAKVSAAPHAGHALPTADQLPEEQDHDAV